MANESLHQPMNYTDADAVTRFAQEHYEELRHVFYDVVWNWLPPDVQRELEER